MVLERGSKYGIDNAVNVGRLATGDYKNCGHRQYFVGKHNVTLWCISETNTE